MNCHKISVYQAGFVIFHPIFPDFMQNMTKNGLEIAELSQNQ